MTLSMVSLLLVSFLARFTFVTKKVSRKYDFFNCFRVADGKEEEMVAMNQDGLQQVGLKDVPPNPPFVPDAYRNCPRY